MIDALMLDCEQTEGGLDIVAKRPDLGRRVDIAPLYALEHLDLGPYAALMLGKHSDQRFLAEQRRKLDAFLGAGRTVVACGHVAHPFLDGVGRFRPIPRYTVEDLAVRRERDHPVWDGVDPADLTWRRGVAGFYGRGANTPPAGARVINSLGRGRHPVDYEFDTPGGGTVLVHAGSDLWVYVDGDNSAARLMPQLLDWVAARAAGRR